MLEREHLRGSVSIDEYSVISCATRVDEIWVPTEWHRGVFNRILSGMGFKGMIIAVVPEAVDVSQFDPAKATVQKEKWTMGLDGLRSPLAQQISRNTVDDVNIGEIETEPLASDSELRQCPSPATAAAATAELPPRRFEFEFLSIFKWEYRKGWDLLLDAYWSAFDPSDLVTLRLRTYIPDFALRAYQGNGNITDRIEQYARQTRGLELSQLPRVIWETGASPEVQTQSIHDQ
jgi:hypothetical protein